jgi:hypothetical protein
MASGYEKHACGVDPSRGWGRPRPFENLLVLAVGLVGLAAWIAAIAWAISALIGAIP